MRFLALRTSRPGRPRSLCYSAPSPRLRGDRWPWSYRYDRPSHASTTTRTSHTASANGAGTPSRPRLHPRRFMGMRVTVTRGLAAAVALAVVLETSGSVHGASIESWLNQVNPVPLPPVSADAWALHQSSVVVDLHADPLLWNRNLLKRASTGHVDLPRLRDGGVALQVFGVVTQFPVSVDVARTDPRWPDAITLLALVDRWPWEAVRSLKARALYQARELERLAAAPAGHLVHIRSRADLDRFLDARKEDPTLLAGLLALEGAHALEGDPANVGALFDAGIRMIGLTHFFDNEFAGSAHGIRKGGLTDKGRALVREMAQRGIIVDLAHASSATIDDVLAMAERPPLVSHTGVRATCDNPRNLSDDQVRAIASAGGVIGIGFWKTAVCGLSPADIARAIQYAVDLVGDDHVAFGSDFNGAVATGFDASAVPAITQALLTSGLHPTSVRKIVGANAVRLIREQLPAEDDRPAAR